MDLIGDEYNLHPLPILFLSCELVIFPPVHGWHLQQYAGLYMVLKGNLKEQMPRQLLIYIKGTELRFGIPFKHTHEYLSIRFEVNQPNSFGDMDVSILS